MAVRIVFFRDPQKARRMAVVIGMIAGALLLAAMGTAVVEQIRRQTWTPITAEVADFSTGNPRAVWTEFTYTWEGESYTVRQKGHSYWMARGAQVPLLCNPSRPQQVQVVASMGTLPGILLMIAGIWGALFVGFVLHALRLYRRVKRLQELGIDPFAIPSATWAGILSRRKEGGPGKFCVDQTFALQNPQMGVVAAGKVIEGVVAPGDVLVPVDSGGFAHAACFVAGIESPQKKRLHSAAAGERCALLVQGGTQQDIAPGTTLEKREAWQK